MTNRQLLCISAFCLILLTLLSSYVIFGGTEGRFFDASPTYIELAQEPIDGIEGSSEVAWLDLMEQRSMAMSTYLAQRSAFVQALTGILGVGLLLLTVVFTKRAADSTRETLEIAQKTLKQNRAYMTFDECIGIGAQSISEVRAELVFKWVNSGDSPAVSVKSVRKAEVLTQDSATPRYYLEPDPDVGTLVVGRGCAHSVRITLGNDQLRQILRNDEQLIVHVCLFYEDVYGRGYKAMLTARVQFEDKPFEVIGTSIGPLKIVLTPVGPQQGEIQLHDEQGKPLPPNP